MNFVAVTFSVHFSGRCHLLGFTVASETQWNNITDVRKRNSWEKPKTDLTTKVSDFATFSNNHHLELFLNQTSPFKSDDFWKISQPLLKLMS